MARPRIHSPKISESVYDYLKGPQPAPWGEHVVSNSPGSNTKAIRGKDISAKVFGYKGKEGAGASGFSSEVSRGRRPVHKADPRGISKKRV